MSVTYNFLNEIKIHETDLPKVRVGHPNDGGYVLIDSLCHGIEVVYSFGVEQDVSFDKAFAERYAHSNGPTIRMFDHTIHGLPEEVPNGHFYKRGIGDHTTDNIDTLENYIEEFEDGDKRMILKMDVEGHEWASLDCCSDETLLKFEQIMFECHGHQFPNPNPSTDHYGQELPTKVLKKLNEHFYMIHAHANNWGWNEQVDIYKIPTLLELSLVRKDLVHNIKIYEGGYPTEHDGVNRTTHPEVDLNYWPFVRSIPPGLYPRG